MNTDWKKILAVVIGLVLLAGVAYLVLWLKPEAKTSEVEVQNGSSTVMADVSGWKTYRNEKYEYEIKYPPDEFDVGVDGSSFVVLTKKGDRFSDEDEKAWFSLSFGPGIEKWKYPILDNSVYKDKPVGWEDEGEQIINNAKTHRFTQILGSGGNRHIFFLRDTGYVVDVSYGIFYGRQNPFSNELERIISTFKFIEPAASTVDTNGWKSYRSEKYKFEVKYPNDWVDESSTIIAAGKGQGLFDAFVDSEGGGFSIVYKPEEAVCGHGVGCFYPGQIRLYVEEAPYKIYGREFSSDFSAYVDESIKTMEEDSTIAGIENFSVAGFPARKVIEGEPKSGPSGPFFVGETIFIDYSPNKIVTVEANYNPFPQYKDYVFLITKGILLSFKKI